MRRRTGSAYMEGFGLIEVLAVLAVAGILYYILVNAYFRKNLVDTETRKALSGSGIDTSRPDTILRTTKEKIKKINQERSAGEWE